MHRRKLLIGLGACAVFAPHILHAGETVLTVSHSGAASHSFDRHALTALPQREIVTTSDWTEGPARFRGPLLRAVLAAADAAGETITARALNDYAVTIPMADARDYDVILAMTQDDAPLSVRTKGPLWIIYPRDDHAELDSVAYNARWIWQLVALHVE